MKQAFNSTSISSETAYEVTIHLLVTDLEITVMKIMYLLTSGPMSVTFALATNSRKKPSSSVPSMYPFPATIKSRIIKSF